MCISAHPLHCNHLLSWALRAGFASAHGTWKHLFRASKVESITVMKQDKELKVSPLMTNVYKSPDAHKEQWLFLDPLLPIFRRGLVIFQTSAAERWAMLLCYTSSPGKHDEAWYTIRVLPNKMILTYWYYLLSKLQKEEHASIKIIPVTPLSLHPHVNPLKWASPFRCRHLLAIQTHSENTGAKCHSNYKDQWIFHWYQSETSSYAWALPCATSWHKSIYQAQEAWV